MIENKYKNLPVKTRSERKFLISLKDYYILSSTLAGIMKRDLFSKEDGNYYVRSIYFDSIDDNDYNEKNASIHTRQKVRLRIYGKDDNIVKLENKRKYGRHTQKSVVQVSRQDALKIIDMNYQCLLKYEGETYERIFSELKASNRKPKVMIDYEREAFVDNFLHVRINFDKKIRSAHDYKLFSNDVVMAPFQNDDYYVLEVKYGEILPTYIQSILSGFDLTETTYSKYLYSRFRM